MKNINLSIPDDVLFEIQSLPLKEKSINDRLQVNLAIGLFASKEISLAKAAELAKKSLTEFMDILKAVDIPCITYSLDMLDDDIHFVDKEI